MAIKPLSAGELAAVAGERSSKGSWAVEYSSRLAKATSGSFDEGRAFLQLCRSRAIGSPADIAVVGAGVLASAGARLRLGFEFDDIAEQTAVAELFLGRVDAAEPRIAALVAAHRDSARAQRLQGMLAEARDTKAPALAVYDAIAKEQPAHGLTLKRRVALAKGRAAVPAGGSAAGAVLAAAGGSSSVGGVAEEGVREAIRELSRYLESYSGDVEAWAELAELQLGLGRAPQAAFCYEECLLVVPNHPEYHTRIAEIQLHRAVAAGGVGAAPASTSAAASSSSSSLSSSASAAASRGGSAAAASAASSSAVAAPLPSQSALSAAASKVASSDAGALTVAGATGGDSASAGALLRSARLHAAEAARLTEHGNAYALTLLADVCWAHVSRVAAAVADAATATGKSAGSAAAPAGSAAAGAGLAFPPHRLFAVSDRSLPTLASIAASAAADLRGLGSGSASVSGAAAAAEAVDAAAPAARSLLAAAVEADAEVAASLLLHRLAAHHLQRLRAEAAPAAASAPAAAAAAAGPFPFTAVMAAALHGPYGEQVLQRQRLLAAAAPERM